ncbi:MAG: N-acetylmuramoyl-L-alanine amidase [Clostridia bacterium]|nr:N-acetylmuramoyl-L-alanine amidase [Clostridia bacterium]
MAKNRTETRAPLTLSYILFIFLFLACTAGMVVLCTLLGGEYSLFSKDTYTPSTPNAPVIVIDAGHGGEDGGTSGHIGSREILEKHLNLDIAEQLATLLTEQGYTVVMTRTEDRLLYDRSADFQGRKKVLDMAARLAVAAAAGEKQSAIFISIHMNSFTQSEYSGLQVYYSSNDAASATLAQAIQDSARKALAPENDRKIKAAGDSIYLLDRITFPAVLVECGFLSNPQECALLDTEEYRTRVAYAIFCGLRSFLAEQVSENAVKSEDMP